MRRSPPPFAAHEWLIAWRYLRARRREGGVSVMTWISLIGIALAVFALIATLAVRTGFRTEFVGTVLGANAHVAMIRFEGGRPAPIADFDARAAALRAVPGGGACRAAGARPGDGHRQRAQHRCRDLWRTARGCRHAAADRAAEMVRGRPFHAGRGGGGRRGCRAPSLGLFLGDTITLISPEGAFTPFGRSLRVNAYRVVYIFRAGRYDIDNTRIYMPLAAAQEFLNHDGTVDQIEVMVADPDAVGDRRDPRTDGPRPGRRRAGPRALDLEGQLGRLPRPR
ncbi:MAG: hypothetical protein KatS3mg118_3072 [Paracoccaceae bacterium]|nr:MAG: hypothetical protein KatS3mg118_3072 [Paracoccaceae bacterium]